MSNNYHVYQARETELATAIGFAITKWANLEGMLLFMCSWALDKDYKATSKILMNFQSFRLTSEFIDTVVKLRLDGRPEITYWRSLNEYIRLLSGFRNHIAHNSIVAQSDGDPNNTDWAKAKPFVGPSISFYLAEKQKRPPLGLEDVLELIRDIQDAVDLVDEFQLALQSEQPLPDKFSKQAVRRR